MSFKQTLVAYAGDGKSAIRVKFHWDSLAPYARIWNPKARHKPYLAYPIYCARWMDMAKEAGRRSTMVRVDAHFWFDKDADRLYGAIESWDAIVAYHVPPGVLIGTRVPDPTINLSHVRVCVDWRYERAGPDLYFSNMPGPCGYGYHKFRVSQANVFYEGPSPTVHYVAHGRINMLHPVINVRTGGDSLGIVPGSVWIPPIVRDTVGTAVLLADGFFSLRNVDQMRLCIAAKRDVGKDPPGYVYGGSLQRRGIRTPWVHNGDVKLGPD